MTSPRQIDVLLFDNVNIVDIAGPVQAFSNVVVNSKTCYRHRFLSIDGKTIKTSCGLELAAQGKLSDHIPKHDLMIPGGEGIDALLENSKIHNVIKKHISEHNSSRLISICSGALILAAAGVLDGQLATTHWKRARIVREMFPKVNWSLNTLYTTSNRIYTSAGVTTGMDLALAIIEKDFGSNTSLLVAKEMVIYLRRAGGQSQFSDLLDLQHHSECRFSELLLSIKKDPVKNWTLEQLANEANMSCRTLTRKFKETLGIPPAQFVEHIRLDHARMLLSHGVKVKQAAADSGFGGVQRMRRSFKRNLGLNIIEYLERFGPIGN